MSQLSHLETVAAAFKMQREMEKHLPAPPAVIPELDVIVQYNTSTFDEMAPAYAMPRPPNARPWLDVTGVTKTVAVCKMDLTNISLDSAMKGLLAKNRIMQRLTSVGLILPPQKDRLNNAIDLTRDRTVSCALIPESEMSWFRLGTILIQPDNFLQLREDAEKFMAIHKDCTST